MSRPCDCCGGSFPDDAKHLPAILGTDRTPTRDETGRVPKVVCRACKVRTDAVLMAYANSLARREDPRHSSPARTPQAIERAIASRRWAWA